MPIIKYHDQGGFPGVNVGVVGPVFHVEIKENSPDMVNLRTARIATYGATVEHVERSDPDRWFFKPTYQNVLALQATWFEWEPDAFKQALQILANTLRKCTTINVDEEEHSHT